ncbi:MAG: hypothetical protein ACYC27_05435 [Armatimonadota bacterium]
MKGENKKMRLIISGMVMMTLIAGSCASAQMQGSSLPAKQQKKAGTTYYINNLPGAGGNNENPGTSAKKPWLDFTPVNSHTFKPGDRILLSRGAMWNQQMTINDSGTAENWCEIGAYGIGSRPRIIRSGDANDRGIRMNNPSYWKLRDIEVGNAGVGILVYYDTPGHEGLSFENILVHDCYGIFFLDMPDGPAKDQAVKDRIFLSAGILITSGTPNVSTTDCVLRNINFDNIEGTHNGDSISIDPFNGSGHPASSFQDITLNHLYLHDDDGPNPGGIPDNLRLCSSTNVTLMNSMLDKECGRWSSRGTAAVFLATLMDITIVNSMFTRTQETGAYDQCAIDYEALTSKSKIRNNYFGQNAGPGIEFLDIHGETSLSDDHEISGNAFEGNGWSTRGGQTGSGGIHHLGLDLANGIIRDNLFYEPGKPMFHGEFKRFKLENNIASTQSLYNSMNGFSNSSGDNGWLYQYQAKDGAWKDMGTYNTMRQAWVTGKAWIGRFEQCASKTAPRAARVWKAPFTGKVTIRGRALKSYDGGGEVTIQITRNDKVIWGPQILAVNNRNGIETNIQAFDVSQGELIRFESTGTANGTGDIISWAPTIAYIEKAGE